MTSEPPTPTAPAASVAVSDVEVTPGAATTTTIHVTNRRTTPSAFALAVTGLEPAWIAIPAVVGPLAPGQSTAVTSTITLPVGYPPSSLLASVEVQLLRDRAVPEAPAGSDPAAAPAPGLGAAEGPAGGSDVVDGDAGAPGAGGPPVGGTVAGAGTGSGGARGPADDGLTGTAHADFQVVVGDSAAVAVRLEPAEIRGRRRGRFAVVLRNRATETRPVQLSAQAPEPGVNLRFKPAAPVLHPGREQRVAAEVRTRAHLFGAERRHPFAVTVAGRGRPATVEGAYTAAALLPPKAAKVLAVVGVVALWAAVAGLGIAALTSHLHSSAAAKAAAAAPTATAVGNGTGGPGTGAPSSGSPSSSAAAAPTVQVTGRVSGPSPGGVTVTLAPTSLVAPQTLTASMLPPTRGVVTTAALRVATPAPAGLVAATAAAATLQPDLAAAVAPDLATVTAPDGSFIFSGVPAPGTYLITMAKAGYATRKYIVQVTGPGDNVTLDASLSPGTGSVDGTVTGPSGPLGGATVTVTDGALTLTTRTPSQGAGVGTWSLSGLNTPDDYLVTASAPGYGTQTTSVRLSASASAHGVDLHLLPGVGSIVGTVTSGADGQPAGGVTVTATSGGTTVRTTTSTITPVGTYTLPNLAIPATWALSFSGAGFVPQTESVALTGNTTVNATLTSSGADVVGVVSAAGGGGLANAGLTLSNQTYTFKTLSESAAPVGGFAFDQVPPGRYVLSATDYGYTSESAQVDVVPGQTQTVDLRLPYVGQAAEKTATVQGVVDNPFTGAPVPGVPIELDGQPTGAVTSSQGTYQLSGLSPGLHTITAVGSSIDYGTASVQISASVGANVLAPPIELPKLDTLTGTVTSAATGQLVPDPTVTLLQGGQPVGPPVSATSTAQGTYTITGIAAGSYVLEVSAKNYVSTHLAVSLGADQNVTENVTLDFGPSFSVVTYADNANGTGTGFAPVSGVCVTVSDITPGNNQPPIIQASTGATPLAFDGLISGDQYRASFAQPPGSTPCTSTFTAIARAPSTTFVAAPNNTSVYSAFLAPVFQGFSVDLSYWQVEPGTGTSTTGVTDDCPVMVAGSSSGSGSASGSGSSSGSGSCPTVAHASQLPAVTLTGTTGYVVQGDSSTGPAKTATVAATAPLPGDNAWTFPTAELAQFIAPQATLTITDPTGPFSADTVKTTVTLPTSSSTSTALHELLAPDPVPVQGGITPETGVTITTNPATIEPSSQTSSANTLTRSDQIAVAEGSGGNIAWSDSSAGAGDVALPGTYNLSFAATGYDTTTKTVTVPLCPAGTCSALTVSAALVQQVSLVVTPKIPAAATSLAASDPSLPPTTVTLGEPSGASVQKTLGSSGSVTFTNALSPAAATPGADSGYSVTVAGPLLKTTTENIAYYTTTTSSSTCPGNTFSAGTVCQQTVGGLPTLTLTPQPAEEGYLTGQVEAILVPGGATQPLGGATVTAKLTSSTTSCPITGSDAYPSQITVQSVAGGTGAGDFTIVGDETATPANGGLCVGGTYTLSVSDTGYAAKPGATTSSAATVSVTIPPPGSTSTTADPTVVPPVDLYGLPVTQVIDLTVNSPSKQSAVDVTVDAYSLVGPDKTTSTTIAVTTKVTGNGKKSYTGTGSVSFTLDPTAYSFQASATNFSTASITGLAAYTPGVTPQTQTMTLNAQVTQVSGTVELVGASGTGTATPIGGLTLSLVAGIGTTGTPVATAITAADGSYTFTPVAGTYEIYVGDGYSPVTPPSFTIGGTTSVTENFDVAANPVVVNVPITVSGTAGGLTSDSVVLKPTYSKVTPLTSPLSPVSCTAPSGSTAVQSGTLLVAGEDSTTSSHTLTAPVTKTSSGTYTALLSPVVPDQYTLSIAGPSGTTDFPPQATASLTVCPGGATNPDPAKLTFAEGTVSGTVTLKTSSGATLPTVTVTATPSSSGSGSGSSASSLSTTCTPTLANGSTTTASCTYTLYVALGTTYSVTASASGYSPPSAQSVGPLTSSSDTATSIDFSLSPAPRSVTVTVTVSNTSLSSTELDALFAGATVDLEQSGTVDASGTVGSTGKATISVAPSSSSYTIDVTPTAGSGASAQTAVGNVTVGIGSGPVSTTATVASGTVSGTITVTGTPKNSVKVAVAASGSTDTPVNCTTATVPAVSGTSTTSSGSYTCPLPLGTYTLSFTASGYTTTTPTSPVTVTLTQSSPTVKDDDVTLSPKT